MLRPTPFGLAVLLIAVQLLALAEFGFLKYDTLTQAGPPLNLQVSVSYDRASLVWEAPGWKGSQPVIGYHVYRSTLPGRGYLLALVQVNSAYDDYSVEFGKTYYYHVRAAHADGEGLPSEEVIALVPLPPRLYNLVVDYFPTLLFDAAESHFPTSFYYDDRDITNNPLAYTPAWPYFAYVHIVENTSAIVVIEFWLYYALDAGIAGHNHDWERVYVYFNRISDQYNPHSVAYFRHGGYETLAWSHVEKRGTNPVVYVSLGKHASYPHSSGGVCGIERCGDEKELRLPDFNLIIVSSYHLQICEQIFTEPKYCRAEFMAMKAAYAHSPLDSEEYHFWPDRWPSGRSYDDSPWIRYDWGNPWGAMTKDSSSIFGNVLFAGSDDTELRTALCQFSQPIFSILRLTTTTWQIVTSEAQV